jgi:hypothetical protein
MVFFLLVSACCNDVYFMGDILVTCVLVSIVLGLFVKTCEVALKTVLHIGVYIVTC